jgi:hypothetical protein
MRPVSALVLALALLAPRLAHGQRQVDTVQSSGDHGVTKHARGTFDVKLTPQPGDSATVPGRLTLDKRFHGDLEGTSQGQMLAASTAVEGSAGYVAIERVSGTIEGRSGTFVLQHSGTMDRGAPQLVITVVPDSGTGGLVGLRGRMTITIEGGKHLYDLEYALSAD